MKTDAERYTCISVAVTAFLFYDFREPNTGVLSWRSLSDKRNVLVLTLDQEARRFFSSFSSLSDQFRYSFPDRAYLGISSNT